MLLPIYTLAAIANIIAKSHNYNIDHELNPYLRVKKSISDVKVNEIERLYPVESDHSDVKQNRHSSINKENLNPTVNHQDELNVKGREKRSYYIPILRPIEDLRSSTSIPTTTKGVSSTIDVFDEPTTTTTDSSYSDYKDDYENGGNFIYKNQQVDTYNNETDNFNNGLNSTSINNTQAYYPLSHTFIPGYNKPKDVFNFEKGPVYTNSTEAKINAEQENEEVLIKENGNNEENNERIKRSYYIARHSSKPGNAQAYYPLSHTYIPGYNTQEDVFDFDQGQVLPNSKNKTSDTPNKSKEKEDSLKKDDRTQGTTTKRPTTKHSLDRMTRSPQRKANQDYEDYTQLHPKNKGPPHRGYQNPTNLDYDNGGEFIVYRPKHVHRVKPKQVTRPKPTTTPHTDPYGYGYDDKAYRNNPYNENRNNYNTQDNRYNNGMYQTYHQNYPTNRGLNGYQYPSYNNQRGYQSNYNDINNSYYQTTNVNVNSLSQNITDNKERTEQNVTDGIEENEETEDDRILKGTCFMCRSVGCPYNYTKIGPSCVRIR
ncbi:putative mediator of RNA polymerase II transcription subunit 26 isoform X4 [Pieris rapae]|uniref:putative mediator of RNA polymerase II transcription subunit 26 isoform X4 n=1 Tax=Pieris rapae TaxID=64459 RepID=UPI001E27D048|nr:putative mediator of RNA polymerase II transcription subunit 26 isoform X4 [Pieris rapae]